MDYQQILEGIYQDIKVYSTEGKQADYIPALARVNPEQFGMCLRLTNGREFTVEDADTRFSIQSISKVFALAMAMSLKGESIWERVGKEPSGTAFNSLVQLEFEKGFPRNPFINAGAIVIADVLMSELTDAGTTFLDFVRDISGNKTITYDREVARSEREYGFLNAAIANLLKSHGRIVNDLEEVLAFYFRMCSVTMSCRDLARAFLAFTNVEPFNYCGFPLTSSQIKRLNAVMQTCGFYDEAGEFSYLVGLPGKSGVGGGIAAVCPGRYAVAVWSPRLNPKGNSVMGMKALELLTTRTEESIF
ncbi:MAG: glutaminase [Candidatus Cryptobacteroides sp.]